MSIKKLKEFILKQGANISVIVKDIREDKVFYKYEESRQVSSASIIKIIIMVEAFNQVTEGRFSLEEIIDIKD